MLSVNSHSAALVASVTTSVNREMEISMERLSTGKRINSAGDDAAGVAIASRLSSEIRGVNQGIRNAMDGQSLINTAEGAHQEIETILQRMREVSVQAANDTNSTLDRTYLQDEIDQLSDGINGIAFSTKWAGKSLMSETNTTFTFQVGATNGVVDQITADIGSMTNDTLFTVPDGFVINGVVAGELTGQPVSDAGDVNGDGFADLIVGSHRANGNKGTSSVVFGKADGTAVNLSDVAAGTGGGFVITNTGGAVGDYYGWTVSGAGDVNGDGLADLIVGGFDADESTVVFGKKDSASVEVSAVGTGGFVITGAPVGDKSGYSVSGAGDVNGDGLDDLIIGAYAAGAGHTGASTVVFGKADNTAVNVSAIGTGGFVINGTGTNDRSGYKVSGAGDVNGDGLDDLIIGAYHANSDKGYSGVVFGKADNTAVNLSSVAAGTGGFVINGIDAGDNSGKSVSGAGDVNGDGLADLIVGGYNANGGRGESSVVFGKKDGTAVELSAVTAGTGGFVINGIYADDYSGMSVSGAGDVNGDGLADLIVGAYKADPNGVSSAGASGVVFGKKDGTAVELSAVSQGKGGFVILGSDVDEEAGWVSGAGDVNGDGLADLIVGSPGTNSDTGKATVVFGKADGNAVELSNIATNFKSRVLKVNVASTRAAKASIARIDTAINAVNKQRAKLGSTSTRIDHAVNNLTNISAHLSVGKGRLEDADFAVETTNLARVQLLQQAATAMMAQAKASKQGVLSLLEG